MGLLDGAARDTAAQLIKLFTTKTVRITRITRTYNKLNATESESSVSADVLATPPFNYKSFEIDGQNVRRGDMRVMFATKDLEAAGIDFDPQTDTDITITIRERTWAVKSVIYHSGGDEEFAAEVQIRL